MVYKKRRGNCGAFFVPGLGAEPVEAQSSLEASPARYDRSPSKNCWYKDRISTIKTLYL
jgi:hypothetical protein